MCGRGCGWYLSFVRVCAVGVETGPVVRRWGAPKPVDELADGLNSTSVLVRVLRGKSRDDASLVSDAVNLADDAMGPFDETGWGIGPNAPGGEGARVPPAPRPAWQAATS
jgi:hypothetical protein